MEKCCVLFLLGSSFISSFILLFLLLLLLLLLLLPSVYLLFVGSGLAVVFLVVLAVVDWREWRCDWYGCDTLVIIMLLSFFCCFFLVVNLAFVYIVVMVTFCLCSYRPHSCCGQYRRC